MGFMCSSFVFRSSTFNSRVTTLTRMRYLCRFLIGLYLLLVIYRPCSLSNEPVAGERATVPRRGELVSGEFEVNLTHHPLPPPSPPPPPHLITPCSDGARFQTVRGQVFQEGGAHEGAQGRGGEAEACAHHAEARSVAYPRLVPSLPRKHSLIASPRTCDTELRTNLSLIDRAVSSFEPRFAQRVLRTLTTLRKKVLAQPDGVQTLKEVMTERYPKSECSELSIAAQGLGSARRRWSSAAGLRWRGGDGLSSSTPPLPSLNASHGPVGESNAHTV